EMRAVGAGRTVLGSSGDGLLRGVVGVQAPDGILLQMSDRHGVYLNAEKLGSEGLDVAFGYPRRSQIGVDVARQHVLRLHAAEGFGVAAVIGAGPLGDGELCTH